jgi:hypothetical protein
MTHLRTNSLIWLFTLILLPACQSIEDFYQAGEYDKAFKAAQRRLEQKPAEEKTLAFLEQSLEALITAGQEEFAALSAQAEPNQWEGALNAVARMDNYLEQARPYLPNAYEEEQTQWWAVALTLEEQLYYHYVELGSNQLAQSLAENNAAIGQRAYYTFGRAKHYQRDHFEEVVNLQDYLAQARQAGIIHYEVAIDDGFNIGLGVNVKQAFSNLNTKGGLFLDIKQVFIANGGDCAIDIDFGEFETSIREDNSRLDFHERIIVDHQVQTDTSGNQFEVPIYAEVEGRVETVASTKVGSWEVRVDVSRRTGNCNVFSKRYHQEASSTIEFYRLSGDERAIPDQYKHTVFQKEHTSDEDLAEEVLDNLVRLIYRDYFNG